jgi:ATP-dependent Lon protease
VPKQRKNNGLKAEEISVSESAIRDVVRYYTREAGVRNLEREISKIFRKVAKELVLGKRGGKKVMITPRNVDKYLGVRRYRYGMAEENNEVGQVKGLAWTEVGGELLTIEATILPGKGKLMITGKLGDVMQESIQAAMSVVRSRGARLGLSSDFYQNHDFHVHVPEGATPKDGPSAGIGMCTAMVSALTAIPVRSDIAMTGEITLRGEILPIGGLKEKLLAAHRGRIKTVLIPEENEKDLVDIPKKVKDDLEILAVRWIDQVFERALERMPKAMEEKADANKKSDAKTDTSQQLTTH